MRVTPSPGNPLEKRARLAGCATLIFRLLRVFWVTWLTLLAVVLYGLYAGWSTPRQWSDAFSGATAAQMLIAAVAIGGTLHDASASSNVRYIVKGNVSDSFHQIEQMAMRQETFSLRVFLGGLFTFLIAMVIARM